MVSFIPVRTKFNCVFLLVKIYVFCYFFGFAIFMGFYLFSFSFFDALNQTLLSQSL